MTRLPFELDHLSDTHLGRKQYPVTSGSGLNQREQDFSRAFLNVVLDIAEADNPLILHSGDWFDGSRPAWRHVLQGLDAARKLTENGRILLIAGGNHDMPADTAEACALELYGHLPGVYVATNKYKVIDLSADVAAGRARPELDKVAVHLLPHDALKTTDWDDVTPWEGYTNILVSHCVVGGTALYKRSIGREYSLPIDVITRGWHYVALGHWHKQGPVAVGGYSDTTTPAWYAGSTENNGFSDVRDSKRGGTRGYLHVAIDPHGTVPAVTPVDLPIRAMFRLPVIDATDKTHDAVTAAMLDNIARSDITGAVVQQVVTGLHPDTWGLVDVAQVRTAASHSLFYDPKPQFVNLTDAVTGDGEQPAEPLGDLASILTEVTADLYGTDPLAEPIAALARTLLGDALAVPAVADDCCADEHTHLPEEAGRAAGPADGQDAA